LIARLPERETAAALVHELTAELRVQRERLDGLRSDLATGMDGRGGADVPARTLDAVLACLAREVIAHEETLDGIVDQAMTTAAAPSLGPLLRNLHAEHESVLGLLGFAERAAAGFVCPEDASPALRALYPALAAWDRRQRALQRRERGDLIPAVLAIDPALGAEAKAVTIPTRRLETFSPVGRRSELNVFCPAERRSVRLTWCETCPVVRHVGGGEVRCVPAVRDEPPSALRHIGDGACVGEALAPHHLVVFRDVAAGEVAAALAETPVPAVVVVDEADHVVGIVAAAEVRASPPECSAGELGRAGLSVSESASLADAVAYLTRRHARFVAVLGPGERVVGVLADLDTLRWVASQAHRG
jgi:CBS domain-containing protein